MSDNRIQKITTDDLRTMEDQEGLVLQGCGGPLQEWVDGINGLLTEAGILLDGNKFENVSSFQHDGVTCLLFPFEDEKLDIRRLDEGKSLFFSHYDPATVEFLTGLGK